MKSDFDKAAIFYDTTFTNSSIGKIQRKQVYKNLDNIIKTEKKLQILELNCGTGEDANYMAKFGHKIIATDISKEMIAICKNKFKNQNIKFSQLDINKIENRCPSQKFDLIFSNFGGFNCLSKDELIIFLKKSKELLNKNGKLALVIMPKNTVWEKLYFSIKGDFKRANRRKTTSFVVANVEEQKVKTWYFNPHEIIKNASFFKLNTTKPIGLFVPPSYLETFFKNKKNILTIFKKLDSIFSYSRLSKYADHFYIELEKK